jgi:hypothetical protein
MNPTHGRAVERARTAENTRNEPAPHAKVRRTRVGTRHFAMAIRD